MSNTYFKLVKTKSIEDFKSDLFKKIENDYKNSLFNIDQLLLSSEEINTFKTVRSTSMDIDTLLKIYILKHIAKDNLINISKENLLLETANKNIKVDKENNYYKLDENKWKKDERIVSVDENGYYIVKELRTNTAFYLLKKYNCNDELLEIQAYKYDKLIKSKSLVIEMLNLKKELCCQFKYSGYNGHSYDIMANLMNKVRKPVESGYYVDSNYRFFKWSNSKNSFVRDITKEEIVPTLVSYEIKNNSTIIRKDYIGQV